MLVMSQQQGSYCSDYLTLNPIRRKRSVYFKTSVERTNSIRTEVSPLFAGPHIPDNDATLLLTSVPTT